MPESEEQKTGQPAASAATLLQEATRRRGAARGWATKCLNALNAALTDGDEALIAERLREVEHRIEALDDVQREVEQLLPEEKLAHDLDVAFDVRDRLTLAKVNAQRALEKGKQVGPQLGKTPSSSPGVYLPKLELPKFSGDLCEWTSFWEKFSAVIQTRGDLSNVTKFAYLESLLEGEAKAAIQGLSVTEANFQVACDILEKRYGRKEAIIFKHIQDILAMPAESGSTAALWTLHDALKGHTRALEVLGVKGGDFGVILNPIILSKLPSHVRMEWARDSSGKEGDVKWLLDFLYREIERRERSDAFTLSPGAVKKKSCDNSSPPTAAALLQTSPSVSTCAVCGRNGHETEWCYTLINASVNSRKEILRTARACFRCLRNDKGHQFKRCKGSCKLCRGRHHALLCDCKASTESHASPLFTESSSKATSAQSVSSATGDSTSLSACSSKRVLLQTIRINIKGARGSVSAILMLDTGSDRSYVSKRIVEQVRPKWISNDLLSYSAFGDQNPCKPISCDVFNVLLSNDETCLNAQLTEIPVICPQIACPPVPSDVFDVYPSVEAISGQDVTVDVLISLDLYWKVMTSDLKVVGNGLVAQRSIFGWILSGTVPNSQPCSFVSSSLQLFSSSVAARCLWESEGTAMDLGTDVLVWENFENNISRVDGRYQVSLPWKEDRPDLLDNRRQAGQRLHYLDRKLNADESLKKCYDSVFTQYLDEDIIEFVPDDQIDSSNPVFYMPHRPVVKEQSASTKVRPVFDASARGYNGVSLNDCLHAGPCLLPNLTSVLIRFRRWKIGISSDVTKAFLQILVHPDDRDVHRFLWKDGDGVVRHLRFRRLPFGNKSSPFLLNATIKHHLNQFESSNTVTELSENLYVDDFLTGADSEEEACSLINEANQIMHLACMPLAKWTSSGEAVTQMLAREFHERFYVDESLKVLGLQWLSAEDCFVFNGIVLGEVCISQSG